MNLGAPEILLILVVALLVFGPHRLPEIGRQVGGAMRELRRMQDSVKSEIQSVINEPQPTYEKPKSAEIAATETTASALGPPTPAAEALEAPESSDAPEPTTPSSSVADTGADEPDHTDPTSLDHDPSPGFDGPSGSFR